MPDSQIAKTEETANPLNLTVMNPDQALRLAGQWHHGENGLVILNENTKPDFIGDLLTIDGHISETKGDGIGIPHEVTVIDDNPTTLLNFERTNARNIASIQSSSGTETHSIRLWTDYFALMYNIHDEVGIPGTTPSELESILWGIVNSSKMNYFLFDRNPSDDPRNTEKSRFDSFYDSLLRKTWITHNLRT